MKFLWFCILCCFITSVAKSEDDFYTEFKNNVSERYGVDYELDLSLLGQKSAPSGQYNAVQFYIYPSSSWKIFDTERGKGSLNFSYSIIRYGNHNAEDLGHNTGIVSGINDYLTDENEFTELYFKYDFKGKLDWLGVGVGQFPIYNFDGSMYNSNQQMYFLSNALSQNATSMYPLAGIGVFAEMNLYDDWKIIIGGQDATNVSASSIRASGLKKEHYTTFGSIEYSNSKYVSNNTTMSLLLYNQPSVAEQRETVNGWSLNLSQDVGEQFNIFVRMNGVDGRLSSIKKSFVLGGVYNNPFQRNPSDQFGLAYAYNELNDCTNENFYQRKSEQIFELFYSFGVGNYLIITPDVQLYFNPALNRKSNLGFVSSLRTTILF